MKAFTLFSLAFVYAAGEPVTTPTPTVTPDGDDKAPTVRYHLKEANNNVCLLVQMAVKMNFTYSQTHTEGNNTVHRIVQVQWDLPNNTHVLTTASKCVAGDANNQLLVLEFFEAWQLHLYFSKDKDDQAKLDNITLHYTESVLRFKNVTKPAEQNVTTSAQSKDFTWSEQGFKCSSTEDVSGFKKGNMTTLHNMQTYDVKIEAFRSKKNDTTFGKNFSYCPADTTVSNIVPIAVGAALAGLVLIVLVAYLIGRSRNKRGYESV